MTFYFKEKEVNNHIISIRQEKYENVFRVQDYDKEYNCIDSDIIYPDWKKANTRFNALCRKHIRRV